VNDWEISLEIDLEKQQGEYQAVNIKDNTCNESQFLLGTREGWSQLNDALKQLEIRSDEEQPNGI
jgi:hypothetical protein